MSATIKDVARETGVSITTVSNALSGRRRVSAHTRERVEEAAKRLGYRPNRLAASIVTGRTRTLGVVVPDISNPFFGELVHAVETTGRAHGYLTVVWGSGYGSDPNEEYVDLLRERSVDALLYCADEEPSPPLAEAAGNMGVPILVLDRAAPTELPNVSHLLVANREGGSLAAQHVVALGHRDTAILGGPAGSATATHRVTGFCTTAASLGTPVEASRIRTTSFDYASGYTEARELLASDPDVTALFCTNDLIALGALRAAGEAGIRVPEQLSIVGFDDIFVAALVHPPLTTIRQPIHALGVEAAETAINLIEEVSTVPVLKHLPVELVVRESTTTPAA